jgi:fatty-acyl-CoA synthase
VLFYDELIAQQIEHFEWPELDETKASSLCYTSGTTGNPKGVLYSHRSTILHSYATCLPDSFNFSAQDCILPVVPMFHVNAWGTPYAGHGRVQYGATGANVRWRKFGSVD